MVKGATKDAYPLSTTYGFVRARQLEGTYPGVGSTGVWPNSSWRISWGWGSPPGTAWRYDRSQTWPPKEPAGVDALARKHLGFRYQRVRSLYECKLVLASYGPLQVSIGLTRDWVDPPKGQIPERRRSEPTLSVHSVTLVGYSDPKRELTFANSWGTSWGDEGYGYMSYRTFERSWCEGWMSHYGEGTQPTGPHPGLQKRALGMREFGGGIHHSREIVGPDEDRMAWAFAVQRMNSLDVEELFVKPQYRRRGLGKALVQMLAKLAFEVQQYPRLWVPYPDATPEKLAIAERVFRPLSVRLREAPVRWAPFVFCDANDVLALPTIRIASRVDHEMNAVSAQPQSDE